MIIYKSNKIVQSPEKHGKFSKLRKRGSHLENSYAKTKLWKTKVLFTYETKYSFPSLSLYYKPIKSYCDPIPGIQIKSVQTMGKPMIVCY